MAEEADSPGVRAQLRGFGPLGIMSIILVVVGLALMAPIAAVLVLLWAWVSGTPWRDIGFVRPGSWIGGLLAGAVFGVALKMLMKAVVMPQLGAPDINPAFHYLAGNARALGEFMVYAVIGAGFAEETVFRGWLFERFGKIFGRSGAAKVLIVLITSALFAAGHWGQGLAGVEQAAIVGLIFGSIFAATNRLWFLIVAHAAFDIAAALIIYLGLEERVAHLVFP